MSCGLRMVVEQQIKLDQKVKLAYITEIRLELVAVLRQERYEPNGLCPECHRNLTPTEIIKGFNQNPTDFTTCCSGCGCRFEPVLVCFGEGTRMEIPFYCDNQTLHQLQVLRDLDAGKIATQHPGVYRSAIIHHGGIRQAFAKIGVDYQYEEIHDWKNKIKPFLGKMSDTMIAECVDVSADIIGRMRRKLGIERFSNRTIAENT